MGTDGTAEGPTTEAMAAVAELHRAYFAGTILAAVARRGPAAAAELMFAVFRRQQQARFLPGLRKLGLDGLPGPVAAARYHYLSNQIGGVAVEYMEESDRKAWIRYNPPRWVWQGVTVCGIPGEVSRAMLAGWHAHNGVSLGNQRMGFVCTKQVADGDSALEGYYFEYDHELAPEERLRFARDEDGPDFDPAAAPTLPTADWPEVRLRKAHRNYAMEYVRTTLGAAVEVFGPADARGLLTIAAKQVGMQKYHEVAASVGVHGDSPEEFVAWMTRVARAQGDTVEPAGATGYAQSTWALMRGATDLHPVAYDCWAALWDGALAAHNRRLELASTARLDLGDGRFAWTVRPRRRVVTV